MAAAVSVCCSKPEPTETPPDNRSLDEMTLYEAFQTQFEANCKTAAFSTPATGSYRMLFDDNRAVTFSDSNVNVAMCASDAWPALTVGDGRWLIDGKDTGIAYDKDGRDIVLVIYDGEGLYARLSDGRMFFFHQGRVLNIGCFRFEKALNPALAGDIICTESGSTLYGRLDPGILEFNLVATVGYRGTGLTQNNREVVSSVTRLDYSRALSFAFTSNKGPARFSVSVSSSTTIPKLYINTGGSGIQKDTYINASLTVEDNILLYASRKSETLQMEIRGRGNSTWGMPKKPYKIKLAEKQRLLGMSESKHWVLLANYSDKTLLRTVAAFEMSRLAGMQFAPVSRPVELYLNGNYEGQYMLTENVRLGDGRIEFDAAAGAQADEPYTENGGYLLCVDGRKLGEQGYAGFKTKDNRVSFAFEDPEAPTAEQKKFVEDYCNLVQTTLYTNNFDEYAKLIDIKSCIHYFFVHEIAKNVDGNMRLSTFMAKGRGGKLYFPCVWDFDLTLGNCDYLTGEGADGNGPTGWYIREAQWFRQLFRNRTFADEVAKEWEVFYPELTGVESSIRYWAKLIDEAQRRNFQKWNILNQRVWPNVVALGTYEAELEYMLKFFRDRVEWMDAEIKAGRHYKTN